MKENRKKLICLWIVFFLVGLAVTSYYRQKQFEGQIEENISALKETVEVNSETLENDWEALDKSDPEELTDYFWEETFVLYFVYFLDFNEYLQREEKLFSGTFRTQTRECALLEVQSKIYAAYPQAGFDWAEEVGISGSAGECYKVLQKYYGSENPGSWDDFVKSDHYEAFLNELFSTVETMKELPLDECYQNTIDYAEKAASRNAYGEVLSESYIFIVETAYHNYHVRKSQKDFAGAIMDAEVVYRFNDNLRVLDRASLLEVIGHAGIDTNFVHVHDIISDTFIVFVLSLLALVVVHFVQIMRLERQY
jgi:hypothetical protein